MPGRSAGIHEFQGRIKGVDGRDKPRHDKSYIFEQCMPTGGVIAAKSRHMKRLLPPVHPGEVLKEEFYEAARIERECTRARASGTRQPRFCDRKRGQSDHRRHRPAIGEGIGHDSRSLAQFTETVRSRSSTRRGEALGAHRTDSRSSRQLMTDIQRAGLGALELRAVRIRMNIVASVAR
jgi:hypothetical protein